MFQKVKYIILICITVSGLSLGLKANNIQISEAPTLKRISGTQTGHVTFGVIWENSWNFKHRSRFGITNWDAAWVFAKYSKQQGVWKHVYISTNDNDHSVTSPMKAKLEVGTSNVGGEEKGVGAFVYRDTIGKGVFAANEIKLLWDYGKEGLLETDTLQFRVFAIEMVYIPQGHFWVGDGTSNRGLCIRAGVIRIESGQQTLNESIDSEDPLYYSSTATAIPADFPKGFQAFYCMKHEISQHAYVDFLNCLTTVQQTSRTAVAPTSAANTLAMVRTGETVAVMSTYRNFIKVRTPANSITGMPAIYGNSVNNVSWQRDTNGGNIACNFLNWIDGLAYADFAGLRPMTELEFEKICRGPHTPIAGEYAWGNAYRANTVTIYNRNLGNEYASGNFQPMGTSPFYVIRVGSFAKDSTTREDAGAGYYGVLNMSDNVWERVINVETAQGRAFDGSHGDGLLDDTGNPNVSTWPNNTNLGAGFRGNQVSDRTNATLQETLTPKGAKAHIGYGFRAVRTAPKK